MALFFYLKYYLLMIFSLSSLFLVVVSFFTAALSATIGMAGGIVLLSIMTFFMPLNIIVPVHGIVQLVSNVYRTYLLRSKIVKSIFGYFCIGLPFGVLLTVTLIKKINNPQIALFLIFGLLMYSVFKPKKLPHIHIPHWGFALVGFAVGFLGPLIGATGPIMATFFLRDDLSKEEIVATKASVQTVGHLVKIPAFLYLGFQYQDYALLMGLMILVTLFGTRLGVHLLGKIREDQFRIVFKIALFAAGCRVLYKALTL